jgi:hypothetical protein
VTTNIAQVETIRGRVEAPAAAAAGSAATDRAGVPTTDVDSAKLMDATCAATLSAIASSDAAASPSNPTVMPHSRAWHRNAALG